MVTNTRIRYIEGDNNYADDQVVDRGSVIVTIPGYSEEVSKGVNGTTMTCKALFWVPFLNKCV